LRLKRDNKGAFLTRTESEAHIEFESEYEQEQAARAHRVEWVSMMLNLAYKENGEDGLRNNGWVDAIVNAAKRAGITNASEEMLVERFKNEGHINLERDMQRLETREGAVAINQVVSTTGALGIKTGAGRSVAEADFPPPDNMEEFGFHLDG
jgi:hypothetical protein